MLKACERLRQVDAKSKELGLVRSETYYLRALLDAMVNMDMLVEVEVLKSLGDVNLERGRRDKNPVTFNRATVLYRTALCRCEDADVGHSLTNRSRYAEKLRLEKVPANAITYEPLSSNKKIPSFANVAEKFLKLDHRLTVGDTNTTLVEYTKLMLEGIVNRDNMLEVEATKSIGDVYLKRGTMTGDTMYLTKATALYNTALARCEWVQGTVALIHRLQYTAKIRQAMKITGNKGPKYRERHRGVLSNDSPATTDVKASIRSPQFMSPSAYIESQTTKQAAPDYRSYDEYLTAGDRALTEGDLDLAERSFASALKLIHEPNTPDRSKEAECLLGLGHVYVQRGKRTKEGRRFTQAAALYNAVMARTHVKEVKVMKYLKETEKLFLKYIANVDNKLTSSGGAIRHKERLESMRTRVKSQLEAIDQKHNPYQI
ncbi:uncharacterized protein LOC144871323 [Branchiostoma floridae x Branchiostoma japonicum]